MGRPMSHLWPPTAVVIWGRASMELPRAIISPEGVHNSQWVAFMICVTRWVKHSQRFKSIILVFRINIATKRINSSNNINRIANKSILTTMIHLGWKS
jgi:hypothetical protein